MKLQSKRTVRFDQDKLMRLARLSAPAQTPMPLPKKRKRAAGWRSYACAGFILGVLLVVIFRGLQ